MNNKIVQLLYQTFVRRGFATLRFNFRGVGKSQGVFDNGIGELSDAASALDWVQSIHPEAETTWIAGVSFGAWIGMQLLMRRPEIRGFISIAPPANMYDFSFLAPCPSSGIIIQGEADEVVTPGAVQKLVDKLRTQALFVRNGWIWYLEEVVCGPSTSTCGPWVAAASGRISSTARLPASMSTPESR